jgi:hypothetical protein
MTEPRSNVVPIILLTAAILGTWITIMWTACTDLGWL